MKNKVQKKEILYGKNEKLGKFEIDLGRSSGGSGDVPGRSSQGGSGRDNFSRKKRFPIQNLEKFRSC